MDNENDPFPKILPSSHWELLGFNQMHSAALERFQRDLMALTLRIMKDRHGLIPSIKLIARHAILSDEMLRHHESLFSTWKYFLNAVSHSKSENNFLNVELSSIELKPIVLDMLFLALEHKRLKRLTFYNNNIGHIGLVFIADFLKRNSSLKVLRLNGNPIVCLKSASQFSEAIKNHPCLEMLELRGCGLGCDVSILSTIMSAAERNLKHLNICGNIISFEGACIVSHALANNHCLKEIMLRNTGLNDEGAVILAQALGKNNNLEMIDLNGNHVSEVGENALSKAIYDDSSLNAIFHSNHVCQILPAHNEVLSLNSSYSPENCRRRKILFALGAFSGSDLRLGHLDDIPAKLMPNVLVYFQEWFQALASRQGRRMASSLSLTFDVMRSWKLPLLYDSY